MLTNGRKLLWQIPLIVLLCVAASLIGVWAVSRAMAFTMNPSLVAALSGMVSGVLIARELRSKRRAGGSSAT